MIKSAIPDAIDIICRVMGCVSDDIADIELLKKGMTNKSISFCVGSGPKEGKYIMRIPGEGTDKLINRHNEEEVFKAISGVGICDAPVYINPNNGYKITRYIENTRVCNVKNDTDITKCMAKLRSLHKLELRVGHEFDIFAQLEFYEQLWQGKPSVYDDYLETKEKIIRLKEVIDGLDKGWCLTHIDAVSDNFLFYPTVDGDEGLQLVDWEYSGMQDPHVDVAMFGIYAKYNKQQMDKLIDIYFENKCDKQTRLKIYCYIAICGLLWSNWCEYKHKLGVEFGNYSLYQYRYAKDYFAYVDELLKNGV
ncbi:choline/ethanolamine kinase family protein [Anaerovibrio lipolyticus]|uniref:choline/ethanolamine kinase family protein n=1 Tax=Anaerovibrio lipolyticus TaxID=82374 RepID=UPI0009DEA217|nr:choline/ethanolamine kinase family protein [Anaerovibrio lipolyticus]